MTTQDPISCPPEVSGARFRRGLLFFSVFFSILLLADVGIVGNLIFQDLSREVINQARARARSAAENVARRLEPVQDGAVRLVQTRTVFARYVEHELQRYTVIERMDLVTLEGELLATRARRVDMERRDGRRGPGFPSLAPSRPGPAVPELPGDMLGGDGAAGTTDDIERAATIPLLERMGFPRPNLVLDGGGPGDVARITRSRRVQDVVVPVRLGAGRQGLVQVSLDPDELDRQLAQLRRDLVIKILIGAAFSVLLIVVAYIFVVKLFHKTRRLETEAQMADRLAYVGTLAAGLAHEIRNPLSAMKLNLQLLEAGLEPGGGGPGAGTAGDEAEVRELLGETRAEVDRLGQLVTSFLSYARPPRLNRKPTDLNRLAEDIVHFLQADAGARGVAIKLDPGDGLPPMLLDATQVRQAIVNVMRNAIAAVEAVGTGTVRLVTSRAGTGEVRLAIEDDGRGIPRERLPHIFQVFYSGRPGGSGLGLPIARRVVEGHGGRIEVDSVPGSGTRFTLIFPAPGSHPVVQAAL